MWFEELTGFREKSIQQVHKNITICGSVLKSHVNGKKYISGILETPTLEELRDRVQASDFHAGKLSVREVVADVQQLHIDESSAGSVFQVASQYNLLEMISPSVTPEHGVANYEYDLTQGPACAVAAGAGTIYRNYFVNVNGEMGQTVNNQINCLADLGEALGNSDNHLWEMKNGYALASKEGLIKIQDRINSSSESEIDELRKKLRVGIQWNTEVTLSQSKHTVTQIYCSALPVAYSQHTAELWSGFAQIILEATYEATICVSLLNYIETGNNSLYLTLIGGGAFGNKRHWIFSAILRSLSLYKHVDIDVAIVSHGQSNRYVRELVAHYS